jgi:IS5 family transposase
MPPRIKRRRLLEEKNLTAAIFEAINAHLAKRGLLMRQGTMVDATPIAAPSSTKNSTGERDPEMVSGDESEPRTAKKSNPWDFGVTSLPQAGAGSRAAGVLKRSEGCGTAAQGARRGRC